MRAASVYGSRFWRLERRIWKEASGTRRAGPCLRARGGSRGSALWTSHEPPPAVSLSLPRWQAEALPDLALAEGLQRVNFRAGSGSRRSSRGPRGRKLLG